RQGITGPELRPRAGEPGRGCQRPVHAGAASDLPRLPLHARGIPGAIPDSVERRPAGSRRQRADRPGADGRTDLERGLRLSGLLPAGQLAPGAGRFRMPTMLMNERTHEPVATALELAVTRRARRRGLLGRNGLDDSEALILAPCTAVHTAFMRF